MATLAEPKAVRQLSYYIKSLCCASPFESTRDDMFDLFEPILGKYSHPPNHECHVDSIDSDFVEAHAILFIISNTNEEKRPLAKPVTVYMQQYESAQIRFFRALDNYIARTAKSWLELGALSKPSFHLVLIFPNCFSCHRELQCSARIRQDILDCTRRIERNLDHDPPRALQKHLCPTLKGSSDSLEVRAPDGYHRFPAHR